jgi:hypothetical protein
MSLKARIPDATVLLSLEPEEAASQLLQVIGPQILRPWPGNGMTNRNEICRFQYSLSFISALMARDGSKQLQTRQLGGEKLNFLSLYGFRTPRMATSTIDKTHARDNHS